MDDGTPKHDPNPRAQCDHICLGEYGHDSPHFYGYRSGTPVDEINRLIDEIERLQEKNEWLDSHVGALIIGFRENKAEIERLRALVDSMGKALEGMSCHNCDDRKCMDCVFRSQHDKCYDDCSVCTPQDRVRDPFTDRYVERERVLKLWELYKETLRG